MSASPAPPGKSAITTHVLDAVLGEPARGVQVRLYRVGGAAAEIGRAITDTDGRVSQIGPESIEPGRYRLVFETGPYLHSTHGTTGFFPEVAITFETAGQRPHYHVPLLLSPFAYSTYRGS